jgi:hypothetical protein
MRLDALKGYMKGIEKMKADRPKLYGLAGLYDRTLATLLSYPVDLQQ